MAFDVVIKAAARPVIESIGAGGEAGAAALFSGVEVIIDRAGAESGGWLVRLAFADFAGLEAEWSAGVATTVLAAAVASTLAGGDYTASILTTAQRALVGDVMAVSEA